MVLIGWGNVAMVDIAVTWLLFRFELLVKAYGVGVCQGSRLGSGLELLLVSTIVPGL